MDESSNVVESSTEQSVVEVTSDALLSSFDVSDEVFDALELDMYRQVPGVYLRNDEIELGLCPIVGIRK